MTICVTLRRFARDSGRFEPGTMTRERINRALARFRRDLARDALRLDRESLAPRRGWLR